MMIYPEQQISQPAHHSPPLKSLFSHPLKLQIKRVTSRAEVNLRHFLTASLNEPITYLCLRIRS